MRHAYALLGLSFLIVFAGAYLIFERAEAPTDAEVVIESPVTNTEIYTMELSSSAFKHNEAIPALYTCDGDNQSPPLTINSIPEGTQSLVLMMFDPDIPEEFKKERGISKFDHWTIYNLPADTKEIPAGAILGTSANNGRGEAKYTGPCPPREYQPTKHRYVFILYALSGQLNFVKAPTLDEVESAAESMLLSKAELIGTYERPTVE
jgi:Raf kinase inhibitor-like YbhB/YbcL family protein